VYVVKKTHDHQHAMQNTKRRRKLSERLAEIDTEYWFSLVMKMLGPVLCVLMIGIVFLFVYVFYRYSAHQFAPRNTWNTHILFLQDYIALLRYFAIVLLTSYPLCGVLCVQHYLQLFLRGKPLTEVKAMLCNNFTRCLWDLDLLWTAIRTHTSTHFTTLIPFIRTTTLR
jgi:hypothetical protein